MKVYIVMVSGVPLIMFRDKFKAHEWIEEVCPRALSENIEVVAYVPLGIN